MPLAAHCRRQLTLFVEEPWLARLESLRQRLDPIQAALIPLHVTLCREDEVGALTVAALRDRVASWRGEPLVLKFGAVQRFRGHGVLVPCIEGADGLRRLRQWLLGSPSAREHAAHVTLAHPRNPRSAGNTDEALLACPKTLVVRAATVSLIEQLGAAPWRVLGMARIGGGAGAGAGPA